ncbi:MAG: ATP-binding protein [Bacteroidetes bacterium]|nr:ATP-binding protein [Bacteroidota bacterium]
MDQKRLELNIASTFDELDLAVEQLQDFIPTLDLDDDLSYRVILLASEALTNAIEHGNKWDENKHATLRLVMQEDRIELTVTDQGEGIHWTQEDPLEEKKRLADHGRGQFFMRKMADEVYIDEENCRLDLVFHCIPQNL